ncbi:MAG TPA: type II toxin-antitoxin system RelE/ParE family toxin [Myxococcales bacterium]|nr:type II toxin-antitoxin system RelE/ParE family toxin [Myxococcales bacterium]
MKIVFYKTAGGASPVEKYLVELSSRERAAVLEALKAIEISGLQAPGVKTRQVKGKLWEVKASQQRVFYVVVVGGDMVLLHAGKKEGQKADRQDLETASLRFRDVTGKKP